MEENSNFSTGMRVTVLNDFLRPEETCTKPSFVYQSEKKVLHYFLAYTNFIQINPENEDGKMVIEYERGSYDSNALPREGQTTIAKITLADCLACRCVLLKSV
jgi:hypothetical protein